MILAQDQHVNFPAMLAELSAIGKTRAIVADALGVKPCRVKFWQTLECHPKHADGERLIEFWCSVTGKARDRVPLASKYLV